MIDKAAAKGPHIGLLPAWRDKLSDEHPGAGPQIFTPASAGAYGRWLGERCRNRPNIIRFVGGDWTADSPWSHAVGCALGRGLRQGDWRHLISFHPRGERRSSEWFHSESWLDFNVYPSGHGLYHRNHEDIAADYAPHPAKPTMGSEPRYESAPSAGCEGDRLIEAFDVRQAAYQGLFAGAHGTTYGAQGVWKMHAPGRPSCSGSPVYRYDGPDLPGVRDMMQVRHLMESRPMTTRAPDHSVIVTENPPGPEYPIATRGAGYALPLLPLRQAADRGARKNLRRARDRVVVRPAHRRGRAHRRVRQCRGSDLHAARQPGPATTACWCWTTRRGNARARA